MGIGAFLNFNKMVTPIIIKIVFWIGVIASIIAGAITMITGVGIFGDFNLITVIGGLLTIFIGPIIVRIYCELLILAFQMFGSLQAIRKHLATQETQHAEQIQLLKQLNSYEAAPKYTQSQSAPLPTVEVEKQSEIVEPEIAEQEIVIPETKE